eukprot:5077865-Ditylum_brightwellii.AAC.1
MIHIGRRQAMEPWAECMPHRTSNKYLLTRFVDPGAKTNCLGNCRPNNCGPDTWRTLVFTKRIVTDGLDNVVHKTLMESSI